MKYKINIEIIRYLLLFILVSAPFFNGLKDPVPLFVFETLVFILSFIFMYFFKVKKTALDLPITLFFTFLAISTSTSVYFNASLNTMLMLLSFVFLFYVTISVYDDKFKKYFYYCFISVSFIISIIIMVQSFLSYIPKATLPNPNLAAGYIACASTIIFSYTISNKISIKFKILNVIFFLFLCFSIILTHSRGGFFALICGISFNIILKFKKWGIILTIFTALFTFVILPANFVKNIAKIDTGDTYSLKRSEIWKSAIKIIIEKPFFGTGPGNFELLFFKYNFPVDNGISRFGKHTRFAHNEFLQIAAESGIFSLFAFIFVIFIIFKNMKGNPVFTSALIAIISHSLVDFNLHLPAITIIAIFLTADILYKIEYNDNNINSKYLKIFLLIIIVFNSINFFFKPFDSVKYKKTADKLIDRYPEKSLELYKKVIEFSPDDFEYRRIIGELFYSNNNKLQAIENLNISIKLNPNSPFAITSLANIYFNLKEFNKAEPYFLRALEIEPNYLLPRYFLAKIDERRGKIDSATNEYKNIILTYNYFKNNYMSFSGYEKLLFYIDISSVNNSLKSISESKGKTR
ncbi:MAG: hypothetical protein A2539_04410 [Elusimicrobia bacterium RIFOXYD2_FULL_34_15]|nr:MAG: hypothetical protein A2539_04410 [Elusimicrobia bacterium RIFOXYD2_FULL_34_15]